LSLFVRTPADRTHEFLPLKTPWLHILLALAEGARHGYAIRSAVEERTAGSVRLWPATLYGALRDMVADGLLEEGSGPAEPGDDARRRNYELTELGRGVLEAEVRRLEAIVAAARATEALARP
jgi:DNA-binding PadR family transcriptional regulator